MPVIGRNKLKAGWKKRKGKEKKETPKNKN